MTWQRATLWSGGYRLITYWALKNPDSPRAQNGLAHILIDSGRPDEALEVLQRAVIRLPNSAHLTMGLLMLKVADGSAEEKDFAWAGERLAVQPFDAQAVKGIYDLVDFVTYQGRSDELCRLSRRDCCKGWRERPIHAISTFSAVSAVSAGQAIGSSRHIPTRHTRNFSVAMRLYGNIDSSMEMVVQMAGYGYFCACAETPRRGGKTVELPGRQITDSQQGGYQSDIARIRQQLQEDLNSDRAR